MRFTMTGQDCMKALKRYCLVSMALMAVFLSFSAQSQTRPLLIVGEEFPPFEFINKKGKVVGIDVDIATFIFRKMGIDFEFALHPWSRAWLMAETGEADAILSTSRKDKRKPYLYYPKEDMWKSEYVFLKNSLDHFPSLNGYEDAIEQKFDIGVIRGNSYNDAFWEAFPDKADGSLNDQLHPARNMTLNLRKLSRQRLDLFISDRTVGLFSAKKMGLSGKVLAHPIVLFSKGYPMPFVRNSSYPDIENLAKAFERELKLMKARGSYDRIVNKWIK